MPGIVGYRAREAEALAKQLEAQQAGFRSVEDYERFKKGVAEAEARYPGKAKKVEEHHVVPQYLGGAAKGQQETISSAYHQLITNKFRSLAPYGQPKPPPGELGKIMQAVYGEYPVPNF